MPIRLPAMKQRGVDADDIIIEIWPLPYAFEVTTSPVPPSLYLLSAVGQRISWPRNRLGDEPYIA